MSKFFSLIIVISLFASAGAFAEEKPAHGGTPESLVLHPAETPDPDRGPQSQVSAEEIPNSLDQIYDSMYGRSKRQVGEAKFDSMPTYSPRR